MSTLPRILSPYKGLNPWSRFKHNTLYPKLYGAHLLSNSLEYCLGFGSHLSGEVYPTERTSVKLNFFYLHACMLRHVLAAQSRGGGGQLRPQQLDLLMRRTIARDNVYIYCTSEFDEQVHEELKRQYRVIERGMLD